MLRNVPVVRLSEQDISARTAVPGDIYARRLVQSLPGHGLTIGFAESLTGGLLSDAMVRVPGASQVLLGSVVCYATSMKHALLGVDQDLLDEHGPVHGDVAFQLACGALKAFGSDISVATTGVAGPSEQDGRPVGRVYIAVARSRAESEEPECSVFELSLSATSAYGVRAASNLTGGHGSVSEREVIRRLTVDVALSLVTDAHLSAPHS